MTQLRFTVFAADPVLVSREVVVDGEEMTATSEGLAVQLISDDENLGSLSFQLTKTQSKDHPFIVGKDVLVSFKGVS